MSRAFGLFTIAAVLFFYGCTADPGEAQATVIPTATVEKPKIPATLAEIVDEQDTDTYSSLTKFDFLNHTYPLPRGWQDVDSKKVTLENGKRRMTEERTGMAHVATKFGDVTGDGNDEAFVILRVGTGGSATPHIVYIFEETESEKPEIIWYFRTGDRADGGLKRVYADKGDLIVELFGKDRYIFSQMETLKIVGDEQQLCCPDSYTKNRYKRISNGFELKGNRLTYSLINPDSPPEENLGQKTLEESRGKN
ncbi:MAG: hypothetical protein HKN33_06115 [Pyrinomonadaceae bacterium]|nr:hypothetical protein [Pyrinomonadaceae bacterium]